MRLAIDLGGTNIRIAAGTGVGPWQHSVSQTRTAGFSPGDLVAMLRERLREWQGGAPRSIGVSVAAVVDEAGTLRASENLGWKDVALGALLREAFNCAVAVETDVYCGAEFEARQGLAKGHASALYVGIGTGVGHAFILNGKVWKGAARGANGFGHLVLEAGGAPCYCGNRGCLCQTASGLAQAERPSSAAPTEALAQAIGLSVTLVEPAIVVLAGGALNQSWFDLEALKACLPRFSYPGTKLPVLERSRVADANLRGALLLLSESS